MFDLRERYNRIRPRRPRLHARRFVGLFGMISVGAGVALGAYVQFTTARVDPTVNQAFAPVYLLLAGAIVSWLPAAMLTAAWAGVDTQ